MPSCVTRHDTCGALNSSSSSEFEVNKRAAIGRVITAVAAVCAISSCTDSSAVGPKSTDGATDLISGPTRLNVVTWDTPVETAQSASATIGVLGGSISLPGTGLTIIVPALALTSPTTITVTAVVGNTVAYEFEPHGLQFNVPVIVRQSLSATSASQQHGVIPGVLYGGYFADVSAINQLNATSLVDEVLRVSIDRALGTATFSVIHFSGYLLGTGEAGPTDGEGMH